MGASDRETVRVDGFPRGVDNVSREDALPDGALRSAVNIEIDKAGKIRLRPGRGKVFTGTNMHSLYAPGLGPWMLAVDNGALKRIDVPSYAATTLRSGLSAFDELMSKLAFVRSDSED